MHGIHNSAVLDRMLEPVGQCLTPEVAKQLLTIRADKNAQARVEELAEKSTEGQLTEEEHAEYEAYIWAGSFVAILQAKARGVLARSHSS